VDKVHKYKERVQRYSDTECFLITQLIIAKVNFVFPNGDTVVVDQSENLLTDIRNEYGETILRVFNHIEPERIIKELIKLKS